jgi:hypothetical protein
VPPPISRPGNNNYSNRSEMNMNMGRSNFVDDGINLRENAERIDLMSNRRPSRPEMKGPSDISDILSGLKTKSINIQAPPQQQDFNNNNNMNDNSTISISDLKSLQGDGNMPKKSRRRQKSASNTVSLDI